MQLQGFLLKSLARFDPRRWHASIATSNPSTGFNAAAFSVRDAINISPDDCSLLRELGFQTPVAVDGCTYDRTGSGDLLDMSESS